MQIPRGGGGGGAWNKWVLRAWWGRAWEGRWCPSHPPLVVLLPSKPIDELPIVVFSGQFISYKQKNIHIMLFKTNHIIFSHFLEYLLGKKMFNSSKCDLLSLLYGLRPLTENE